MLVLASHLALGGHLCPHTLSLHFLICKTEGVPPTLCGFCVDEMKQYVGRASSRGYVSHKCSSPDFPSIQTLPNVFLQIHLLPCHFSDENVLGFHVAYRVKASVASLEFNVGHNLAPDSPSATRPALPPHHLPLPASVPPCSAR